VDLGRVAGLWEGNQEFLRQRLGRCDSNRYNAYWVLTPEAPFPRFNHISHIRVDEDSVFPLIAECRAFYRTQGMQNGCLLITPATQPADLAARLYRLGFTSENNPIMIWDGRHIPEPSPLVRVERALPEDAPLVFELIRRVFLANATVQTLVNGRRGVAISYELEAVNYIAYIGSRPAGVGMLFVREGMGGIYNMGTLPEFRGRGVATAIMAAALGDARAADCSYVGLTPTSMGRPLYERLGFREAYQERYFVERL
jgi:GNAT superfamily N-acetyltransferase